MNDSHKNWHQLSAQQAFDYLGSGENGLSSGQAEQRLVQYGANHLTEKKPRSILARLLSQFHSLLIYVLLLAAFVTALLGQWLDCGVIIAVVLLNALIGFIQEGKAEKALEAIRKMLSQHAAVKRDGMITVIPAEQLVIGDVVLLRSGDKVPADLRLLQCRELHIDEAILTGESQPSIKQTAALSSNPSLADRSCMAYSGSLVCYGQGQGIVVATGDHTEIGYISALLQKVQPLTTPLLQQMAHFSRWLTGTILLIALLISLFGIFIQGFSLPEMFLTAVGLAVAAIPEGLPAIMTITLAIGVQRMAKRKAIIRHLPAVETLGALSVICTDKTGTLTRNEMTVQSLVTSEGLFSTSGVGYDPHGSFLCNQQEIDPLQHPVLREILHAAVLCNDARLQHIDEQWQLQGAPTEGALITLGLKAGLDLPLTYSEWPRIDAIPFESQHRYMATLHHDHAGHGFIYIKGAPERILEMCCTQRMRGEDTPLDQQYWQQQIEQLAQQEQRLLAIAFKPVETEQHRLSFNDIDRQLTLLGVVGIIDPPREEAINAIARCQQAGIQVKMITGDHATTALAIAQRIGLHPNTYAVSGNQLDQLDEQQLQRCIAQVSVFARTTPQHKLRLVESLQATGHVVAMTGDGVNDAPALKRADVGIAMGKKGSEVSKEAAEMVLSDDNFISISHAIEEGRTVYDNLKKAILFILPTNGGEALTLIAAVLLGFSLPITPAQILWVNMITAVTLALALAFEPTEPRVMQRPPRSRAQPILSAHLIWRTVFVSLLMVTAAFGLFLWQLDQGASIEYARTVVVNTLVACEIAYLFNTRSLNHSACHWQGFTDNRYVLWAILLLVIFQLGFTYLPTAHQLFHSAPLNLTSWGQILLVSVTLFLLVELEKWLLRYK